MSIKRRNANGRERAFPPEVVAIYRELCRLDQVRDACDKGKQDSNCKLPFGDFCADCTRRHELSQQVYRLLNLRPWQWPFGYRPQEPAGLTAAQLDAWWARELSAALAVALADK